MFKTWIGATLIPLPMAMSPDEGIKKSGPAALDICLPGKPSPVDWHGVGHLARKNGPNQAARVRTSAFTSCRYTRED